MITDTLRHKLAIELDATHIDIVDNSWQHAGHAGVAHQPHAEGTHLQITVVSPQFEGVSRLNRHRKVHQALQDAFATHLHALELKTYTPNEWPQEVR